MLVCLSLPDIDKVLLKPLIDQHLRHLVAGGTLSSPLLTRRFYL